MIDPNIIVKANYNRQLVTIRVSAINSPDWTEIVSTRIELSQNSNMSNPFDTKTTTHYKVRAYIEFPTSVAKPDTEVYGRVTLTKSDNTTLQKTFHFTVPLPILGTIKGENGTNYVVEMMKMDKNGTWSNRHAGKYVVTNDPPYIDIMADEAGNMLVGNQWTTSILVQNITQGGTQYEVSANNTATIPVVQGDIVRVSESTPNTTFRTFASNTNPLCKGVSAHIVVMPPMNKFTETSAGTSVKGNFFYAFNQNGTLTSLPEGSFDTHKIVTATNNATSFFAHFNWSGALTSLPEGSFDTSALCSGSSSQSYSPFNGSFTNAGFGGFNAYGALTSLPEGSFDFDNAKYIYRYAFQGFNQNGALTSLPEGSFGFSSITLPYNNYGNWFPEFTTFNYNGNLATMPAGAFHYKPGLTGIIGYEFNTNGALTSLPEYSFNFLVGGGTFTARGFNKNGALTSLPEGSFRLDPSVAAFGSSAFSEFNSNGALTSLPEHSFNTENITNLAELSFRSFNSRGALVSLPEGSFNFDNVTTASSRECFMSFNYYGALKTLPKGSFSFPNLTNMGNYFASQFNEGGMLEYLPIGAFSVSSATTVGTSTFMNFNTPDYDLATDTYSGGLLTKSETDYNPEFIYPLSSSHVLAYYYDKDNQTYFTETVSYGNPFKYYEADYFSVTYTPSQAYTTDLADSYLSGQTITFSAAAVDPEYLATPTITTAGGTTVTVTDNGDDTYTFVMPQDDITVNITVGRRPAVITLTAEEAGTMVVVNKWTTPVLVKNITQATPAVTVSGGSSTNVAVAADDEVTVTEGSANVTFRNWINIQTGICRGVLARVSSMPDMNRFTSSIDGTSVSQYFFQGFCAGDNGKGVTSLPAGSFDISDITNINSAFFSRFNYKGLLTSLPSGSFHFNTINNPQSSSSFFYLFNSEGALTSLPVGSFNIDSFTGTGNYFFDGFNKKGALTSLPVGSFNTSNISSIGTNFFTEFNNDGALTSLPAGSFNIDNVPTATSNFFQGFNKKGKLVSLPAGSFNISNVAVTNTSYYFFTNFNDHGELTSLPAGSFDTSNITTVSTGDFFENFNAHGALTSLPAGSFDTSNMTLASSVVYFFTGFNSYGALTSLPAGSFKLTNITTLPGYSFNQFNSYGALTSLPAGSFNTDNVTTITGNSFYNFNDGGALTSLPTGSFNFSNVTNVSSNSSLAAFFNANGGKIPKSTTAGSYNPGFVNVSSSAINAQYWDGSTSITESIASGAPFYFKTA